MNEYFSPPPGEIWLLHSPPREAMHALVARLAVAGPLVALDAGDELDIHQVARLIRRQTRRPDRALRHVRVGRAFTCHQVAALFAGLPASAAPHVVFDLPGVFLDERVSLRESRHLLRDTLDEIERLRQFAPFLISTRATDGRRAELSQAVADLADHLFAWESPGAALPVRLF